MFTWYAVVMFIAGVLAYMIATFNGGYVWHLVLFNEMYLALKTWSRFDDVVIPMGAAAIFIQVCVCVWVRETQRESQ